MGPGQGEMVPDRDLTMLTTEEITKEFQAQLGEAHYRIAVLTAQLKKAQSIIQGPSA